MSNKSNKPQWLIDAEKAIAKAAETKFGKMTDKEMRNYEAKANAARAAVAVSLKKGTHNFQNGYGHRGWASEEHQLKASKLGGIANKGIPKPHSKKLAKKLDVEWTCEHCNTKGRGIGNLKRYGHHDGSCLTGKKVFKKSTLEKFDKMCDLLQGEFTKGEAIAICKANGFGSSLVRNLFDNTDRIECVHEGEYRSKYNPSIYKVK